MLTDDMPGGMSRGARGGRNICGNADPSQLDSDLAEIYKEAVPKDAAVKADQSKWLKARIGIFMHACSLSPFTGK